MGESNASLLPIAGHNTMLAGLFTKFTTELPVLLITTPAHNKSKEKDNISE